MHRIAQRSEVERHRKPDRRNQNLQLVVFDVK